MSEHVWYAGYGSNLNEERLMCYLKGGRPQGAVTDFVGSRDETPPRDISTFETTHELYFAEHSSTWDGAVAFIIEDASRTLFKMYEVKSRQFKDIASQEVGLKPGKKKISLDRAESEGHLDFCESWYGRIVYLGDHNGEPIFTVTSPVDRRDTVEEPSEEYLYHIVKGLKEGLHLTEEEIYQYLKEKKGVTEGSLRNHL